jgi:hypothetical protein
MKKLSNSLKSFFKQLIVSKLEIMIAKESLIGSKIKIN